METGTKRKREFIININGIDNVQMIPCYWEAKKETEKDYGKGREGEREREGVGRGREREREKVNNKKRILLVWSSKWNLDGTILGAVITL